MLMVGFVWWSWCLLDGFDGGFSDGRGGGVNSRKFKILLKRVKK